MNSVLFNNQEALVDETSLREVYESVEDEFKALSPSELQIINVDVPAAVAIVLGVLPRLRAQRATLATLPDFSIERFDKLETYAQALTYAHRLYLIATQPPDDLRQLQEEGSKIRDLLFKDASVAVARGWIEQEALDDLKGANGYKNTATDLQILVGALQVHWSAIQGRVGTSETELEYAEKLAFHLLRTYGEQKNSPEGLAEAVDRRQRAFTVFFKTYDETRQAMAYIRRQFGDTDRIAPSLFTSRTAKRKSDAEPAPVEVPSDEPTLFGAAPVVPDGAPGVVSREVTDPFAQ